MATVTKTINSTTTHTGLSGDGDTLYSTQFSDFDSINEFSIDVTATGDNQPGSGVYPGISVRVVNQNDGVLYRWEDVGSWSTTSDRSNSPDTLIVFDDSPVTQSASASTTSSPAASVTDTLTVEIYDSQGGGDDEFGRDSIQSIDADVTIDGVAVGVSNFTAVASGDDIDLTWDALEYNQGHRIYRAESSGSTTGDYTEIADVGGSTESYTDTDLEDGERFFYRVEGYDGTFTGLSSEDDATTALPSGSNPLISKTGTTELTISVTREDDSTDGGWELYRSTDGSLGPVIHSTTDPTDTDYVDSVSTDTSYYYTWRRFTDHVESDSTQESAGIPTAPSDITVSVVNGDQLQVDWTDNSSAEEGYRVFTRPNGGTWSQDNGDLDPNTESHTTEHLRDGELYDVRVASFVGGNQSAVNELAVATTELPDAQQPTLGNGVEDEIEVDIPDVIDYGEYDIQYRETGAATWITGPTVDESTTSTQITGLEDGEEYEVRLRTRTEHVTGDWTTPVSIVTQFSGATNLSVTAQSKTQIDGEFDDVSDNEDGFEIQRSREYPEEWGPWRDIETLDPNTESFTDDTVQQTSTYRYRVRAFTDHTEAFSNTDSATTDASDAKDKPIPGGWHVEIDHPETVKPLTPSVLDGASKKPIANALPKVEIPVKRDERWQADAFTEANMRVWVDGERQPIDTLVRARMEEGQTVLKGRGGSALLEKEEREIDFAEAHAVAEDLIETTPYVANVDDPVSSIDEDVSIIAPDSQPDLQDSLQSFDDQTPLNITDSGEIETKQTAWFAEAEGNEGVGTILTNPNSDTYSGDQVVAWDTYGDQTDIEFTFELDHEIPAGAVDIEAFIQLREAGHHGVSFWIDDILVERFFADSLGANETEPSWIFSQVFDESLSPGEHTARFWYSGEETPLDQNEQDNKANDPNWENPYVSDFSDTEIYADCMAVYDNRYDPGLTDTVNASVIEGPDLHPSGIEIQTQDYQSPFSVVGGGLDVTVPNGTLPQLELSNDQGGTWEISDTDTTSIDGSFDDPNTQIRARLTLGGYDTNSGTSPAGRKASHSVDAFELFADLDDTPTLANRTFDAQLKDILSQIADDRNFYWYVDWDASADTMSVEFTQPGQRFSDENPDVASYRIDKQTEDLVEQLTVKGASQPRSGEDIAPGSGEENAHPLEHVDLVPRKEAVTDTDADTQYVRGEDYNISYLNGEVWVIDAGDMTAGDTYEIDYQYKIRGTYPEEGDAPSDARQDSQTIPGLGSERICRQAAYYIVERSKNPIWEGTISLPKQELGWSVVDAIDPDNVPTSGNRLEVVSITENPSTIDVKIRNRRTVSEIVDDLSSGVNETQEYI